MFTGVAAAGGEDGTFAFSTSAPLTSVVERIGGSDSSGLAGDVGGGEQSGEEDGTSSAVVSARVTCPFVNVADGTSNCTVWRGVPSWSGADSDPGEEVLFAITAFALVLLIILGVCFALAMVLAD